jgi:hypothetical protein
MRGDAIRCLGEGARRILLFKGTSTCWRGDRDEMRRHVRSREMAWCGRFCTVAIAVSQVLQLNLAQKAKSIDD